MKPIRVYIDTSVVGGCLDPKFRVASLRLFHLFRGHRTVMVASDLLQSELQLAPPSVRGVMNDPAFHREEVLVTADAIRLAALYLGRGVIGGANYNDALHVATATVHRVDVLVSWDFRHIFNPLRARGYNEVNAGEGYPTLHIRSPGEVVHHGGV